MKSDPKGCECAESRVRNTQQIQGTKPLSTAVLFR